MTQQLPILLYDGDCGFCTRSVRAVERLPHRARLVPWQESDLATLNVTEERARYEVLWVRQDRHVFGGAPAAAELLKHCGGPWRLLGLGMGLPLVRTFADLAYRRIAANRHRLPGVTPACQLREDQRPGATGP